MTTHLVHLVMSKAGSLSFMTKKIMMNLLNRSQIHKARLTLIAEVLAAQEAKVALKVLLDRQASRVLKAKKVLLVKLVCVDQMVDRDLMVRKDPMVLLAPLVLQARSVFLAPKVQ